MQPEVSIRRSIEDNSNKWFELFRRSRKVDGIVPFGGSSGLPELFRTMGEPRQTATMIEQIAREFIGRETILTRTFDFSSYRYVMSGILDSQAYIRGDDRGGLLHAPKVAEHFLHFLYSGRELYRLADYNEFASVKVQFEHCTGFTLHFTGMYRLPEVRVSALKVRGIVPPFEARMSITSDDFPEGLNGVLDRIFVELFRWFGLPVHMGAVDENWRPQVRNQ